VSKNTDASLLIERVAQDLERGRIVRLIWTGAWSLGAARPVSPHHPRRPAQLQTRDRLNRDIKLASHSVRRARWFPNRGGERYFRETAARNPAAFARFIGVFSGASGVPRQLASVTPVDGTARVQTP